jgi:hypothetical protein
MEFAGIVRGGGKLNFCMQKKMQKKILLTGIRMWITC